MWRHTLKDWELVPKDSYKFILEQSDKRLKDILDDGEKITSRAYGLIGIIAPLFATAIGVILKKYSEDSVNQMLFVISVIDAIVLSVCLYFLFQIIKVRAVWNAGTEPKKVLLPEYVEIPNLDDEEKVKYLFLSEIEQNQHRIDSNRSVNLKRIETFKNCLIATVLGLITFIGLVVSLFVL